MPIYYYAHENTAPENSRGAACPRGAEFSEAQAMSAAPLTLCPDCGGAIYRVIKPAGIAAPQSDSDLRRQGFAKLVKRDNGVYENVTALDGESRYVQAGRPETMPDLKRRNLD